MEAIFSGSPLLWEPESIDYFKQVDDFSADSGCVAEPTDLFRFPHTSTMVSHLITPPEPEVQPTEKTDTVSVSSSFFPGSHNSISDTIFRSSDAVLFYVNARVVLKTEKNAFQEFLGASLDEKRFRDVIIDVPESSAILDIIVHILYGISCAKHNPSFDDLEAAINRMPVYGLVPRSLIVPSSPLYELLLSHAPIYPIQIYSLAGHLGIHELAINTSSHLLSYNLAELTDDLAKRMGAKYLRRLMSLHLNLIESLKSIILQPPHPHPATPECDFFEQKKLSRAWALSASYLVWDSRPDLSIHGIQSTFSALGDRLTCDECKGVLHSRIKEVIVKWVNVKRTI